MQFECGGDWLSGYVDEELAVEEAIRAEAHLASCSACQARVQELRRLDRLVAAALPAAPLALAQKVLAALPDRLLVPQPTPAYLTLGIWTTVALALTSLGLFTWLLPGLSWAWKVIHRLSTIVWAAGIWHLLTPAGLLRAAAVLVLCSLLFGAAIYGTRQLDRPREVAH